MTSSTLFNTENKNFGHTDILSNQNLKTVHSLITSKTPLSPSEKVNLAQRVTDIEGIVEASLLAPANERTELAKRLYPVAAQAKEVLSKSTNDPVLKPLLERLQAAFETVRVVKPGKEDASFPSQAQWMVESSNSYKENLEQVKFDKKNQVVVLPKSVVDDSLLDAELRKNVNKKSLHKEHIANETNKNAKPAKIAKKHAEWKAVRIDDEGKMHFNEVHGTSFVSSDPKDKLNPHLTNIHYRQLPNGRLSISCGVINTPQKAAELAAVIKHLKGDDTADVKIIMQQLNSNSNEYHLVTGQHHASQRLNAALDPNNRQAVAHLNLASNASSNLPTAQEDWYSYEQNILGLAQIIGWTQIRDDQEGTIENLKKMATVVDTLRMDMVDSQNAAEQQKVRIKENYAKITNLQKEIKLLRGNKTPEGIAYLATLRTQLDECTTQTPLLEQGLNNLDSNIASIKPPLAEAEKSLKKLLEKTRVLCKEQAKIPGTDPKQVLAFNILDQMIARQTSAKDKEPISRVSELEQHLFLVMLLNEDKDIVIVINCKSGIDRTGLVKALWEAMHDLRDKYKKEGLSDIDCFKKIHALLQNLDRFATDIDNACYDIASKNPGSFAKNLNEIDHASPGDAIFGQIQQYLSDKPNIQDAWFYEQRVLKAYFRLVIPATVESTSAAGAKYGHNKAQEGWTGWVTSSVSANPLPFWRLPPFLGANDPKTGELKAVQLYTKGGRIYYHWPTEAGLDLILRNSLLRGD